MTRRKETSATGATEERRKRGRRTVFGKPMTPAERKQRSRQLARQQGVRVFAVSVHGSFLERIEDIAHLLAITPAEALTLAAKLGSAELWLDALDSKNAIEAGVSEEENLRRLLAKHGLAEGGEGQE